MTEDEAKKKWCPMARYALGAADQNAANRWPQNDGQSRYININVCNCIGPDCMMWRIDEDEYEPSELGPRKTHAGKGGHCGLAGKP